MIKDNLKTLAICTSIIIGALIIGACILRSADLIAVSIERSALKGYAFGNPLGLPGAGPVNRLVPVIPGSKRIQGVTAGDNPLKGKSDAPVLIVEFSDFQCPFSQRFYKEVLPLIEKEYISSGKVKFAYRDFPLDFHTFARPAAIACRAAGKGGKYWMMFDKINQGGPVDAGKIQKYAKEIGLDLKVFNDDLNSSSLKNALEKDLSEGKKLGIQGTPGFFINGRFLNGALPFPTFKEIIDQELKNPQKK